MSINQNTKKVIGMYNASNPLINNASQKEIDSILSSYFSSQSATINNSITEIVTEKIEPILSQQSLQLADIRSSLNNIYERYISDINIEDIDSSMNEQIMNVLNSVSKIVANIYFPEHDETVKIPCAFYSLSEINALDSDERSTIDTNLQRFAISKFGEFERFTL